MLLSQTNIKIASGIKHQNPDKTTIPALLIACVELPLTIVRELFCNLISSTLKSKHLEELQQQLQGDVLPIEIPQTPNKHLKCPYCKKGDLVTLVIFGSRGPPKQWIKIIKKQNSAK